jgi:hypothetical protein
MCQDLQTAPTAKLALYMCQEQIQQHLRVVQSGCCKRCQCTGGVCARSTRSRQLLSVCQVMNTLSVLLHVWVPGCSSTL